MKKIIHYCWFGPKPIPKLTKKCIASWKKYLPDYEIKLWNEQNSNVEECKFVKQAYEEKRWAFVSDYIRLKALYDEGGIYFDTDMEVMSNVDFLKEKEFFIGREYSGYIAAGVIGVKSPNNPYIKEMLEEYQSIKKFNTDDLFKYAIPKVITKVLEKYEQVKVEGIEIYNQNCYVYPVDYFYPVSYDRSTEFYSQNTCMIHYYDATWVPKREKITIGLYRSIGKRNTMKLFGIYRGFKSKFASIGRLINKAAYVTKKGMSILLNTSKRLKRIEALLDRREYKERVVIANPDWLGVFHSTQNLCEEVIEIREVYKESEAIKIAKLIVAKKPKLVIFSGFALRWWIIAKTIKELDNTIVIKVMHHGGNALLVEKNDFLRFSELVYMMKEKIVAEVGFFKQSMAELFAEKGYRTSVLYNVVDLKDKKENILSEVMEEQVKIGIYLSRDRWEKNMYNQISAASLIENAVVDAIPMTYKVTDLAGILGLEIAGEVTTQSSSNLYQRMANNAINFYVTFTEASPLIPLESFELGVPCLTGNNHELFLGSKLAEYVVVDREDDITAIASKAKLCLAHKEEVMKLYEEWKEEYDKKAVTSHQQFLKV